MIMDNPGDVAIGVNKVEVILNETFFNIFKSLIIKYFDSGEIKLMFNSDVLNPDSVLSFFAQLKSLLGSGTIHDDMFSSFNDKHKVNELAAGRYSEEGDEIIHSWHTAKFGYTLNYKTDPLRQLVFSVSLSPKKVIDHSPRKKGTLLYITRYHIHDIIREEEVSAVPFCENGNIKYIDYTFKLDPPELDIFDLVRIRIFGNDKKITTEGQFHVVYYSKFEIDTANAIVLCDKLVRIYGADSHGDKELQPHEMDLLEAGKFWTGRNWWLNQEHGMTNFTDPNQIVMYWVLFTSSPDEDGLSLHVTGYNEVIKYHKNMI
jgi:hypothetical protein